MMLHNARVFPVFSSGLLLAGVIGLLLAWGSFSAGAEPAFRIDADFPGGNIVVQRIEGSEVFLHQDPRDTPGFWFYWYFRVREAAGQTLRFHFTQGNVLGVRGPAVSSDGGQTWRWLGAAATDGASFTYSFPDVGKEVRFALAMPYLQSDLDAFLAPYAENPHLRVETLTHSRQGRAVEQLHFGQLNGDPDHRVLLTCRHHACESMASWALEGMIEVVLSDTPDGQWFRQHVELLAFPFMDKDGVQDGDQGKNRAPYDHNRDYLGDSMYPEVAALRRFVPEWAQGRLRLALDLHCPWIRGGGDRPGSNEQVYFVGGPSQEGWQALTEFSRILEQVRSGPLPFATRHNLPYGESWNTLEEPRSFGRWAALLPGIQFAATIEIPYANAGGQPVTPETARALGRDLAHALRAFLIQTNPDPQP